MQKKASLFKCPVCSKPLFREEKQYRCENEHNYDISKKGYVNLLLRKDKGSGDPGDTKEMLCSRREFLAKGYYEIFSNAINKVVLDDLADGKINSSTGKEKPRPINILDAGCGEGYYLRRLSDVLISDTDINLYGIDVSKSAVHLAAGGDKRVHFAVGSTYHIPLQSNSMDYVLCIFSPRDEAEFLRILKPGGKLIVAAPGPRHLFGFKMALYQDSEEIGQKGTVGEGFSLIDEFHITYTIALHRVEDILNLLTMTPYVKHTDEDMVKNLKKLTHLSTEVDFNIYVYQR